MRENGELTALWKKWKPDKGKCFVSKSEPIQTGSLLSAFVMLVVSHGLSIISLLLELLWKSVHFKNTKEYWRRQLASAWERTKVLLRSRLQ